ASSASEPSRDRVGDAVDRETELLGEDLVGRARAEAVDADREAVVARTHDGAPRERAPGLDRDASNAARQDVIAVRGVLVRELLEARRAHDARLLAGFLEALLGPDRELHLAPGRDDHEIGRRRVLHDVRAAEDVLRVEAGVALEVRYLLARERERGGA